MQNWPHKVVYFKVIGTTVEDNNMTEEKAQEIIRELNNIANKLSDINTDLKDLPRRIDNIESQIEDLLDDIKE